MKELRNPIDWLIYSAIVVVAVILVIGIFSNLPSFSFTSKNWKDNFEVYSDYNDMEKYEFTVRRYNEDGNAIDKPLQIETIVLRIERKEGFSYTYTWKVEDEIAPLKIGDSAFLSLYIEDILKKPTDEIYGITVTKVTYSVVEK